MRRLSVAMLVLANAHTAAMTGNANYTTPDPALAAVTTATQNMAAAYNVAQAARDLAKQKTDLQDAAEKIADAIMTSDRIRQKERP